MLSTLYRSVMRLPHKVKLKYLVPLLVLAVFLCDFMGVFVHFREADYHSQFTYPLEGDIDTWVGQLKRGERPDVAPINRHEYVLTKQAKGKCVEEDGVHYVQLRLVYLVKSAMDHFERRQAIRETWGFERRFSDVGIRTVFLLGSRPGNVELQRRVEEEAADHGDIVQGDFVDAYYNNTIKTLMGLRWAVEQCPTSRFYFYVDDDYYVSTRNALRFLRNPANYPGYLNEPVLDFDAVREVKSRKLQQLVDFDIPEDVRLFAGFVFHTPPHRHKTSPWYVSLEEYPYHLWPPYVTAGAYVLSRNALVDIYYASYFVQKFRFDDIYLGIVAKKIGLEPFHSGEFYFDRKPYRGVRDYEYVVASHGFSDPHEMARVWNQQKQAGNA